MLKKIIGRQLFIDRMTIESSEIFGIHSECHKPTGVEESCVLNFYNDQEENLVTTTVNILTVYRIRKHVNIEGDEKKSFELVEEFELWGTICSICKVRFNGSLRDSILLRYVLVLLVCLRLTAKFFRDRNVWILAVDRLSINSNWIFEQ